MQLYLYFFIRHLIEDEEFEVLKENPDKINEKVIGTREKKENSREGDK
jgi:hypothetical protein